VLDHLESLRTHDVRWREGRAFTLAYYGGREVHDLAETVYGRFMSDNALNTDAFPSLAQLQAEVVDTVLGWLTGTPAGRSAPSGPLSAGYLTSGGTESILMAVLAARERGVRDRGVTRPNMVLAASAHAAFEKAAHYFGVESRRVPVGDDWRADPEAMAAQIDASTVLVVASAPQYPQGVIDPVAEIAALAGDRGANCHVDACMGGVTLTYMSRLGEPVPAWSFAVEGVTSISVDLHKFGYAGKGASVIAHRTKSLRRDQTFVTDNWLGGHYGSSGVLGTKSGAPIAAAWAVMQHLGEEGYLRLTAAARTACLELAAGIAGVPGLTLRAQPEATLLAFGSVDEALDVFAVADELWRRGWYLDRQGPPNSLHCTVNAVHAGVVRDFLGDLAGAVETVRASGGHAGSGSYATVE
jgi:sphinganine-1-phosphate aldolase